MSWQYVYIVNDDTSFYVPLAGECITMVIGETGTGKSFLFEQLRQRAECDGLKCYCVDYETRHLLSAVYNCNPDYLVVLDDLDNLREYDKSLDNWLNTTCLRGNRVLGFGRDLHGVRTSRRFIFDLVKKDNHYGVQRLLTNDKLYEPGER